MRLVLVRMPTEEIIRIRYQGELRWNTYGEVARHVYATRGAGSLQLSLFS